ncbi:O-antigen polymerase [Rhodohalobacter barkolensis]|uniref:Oligosaccharide repeat unit polymerase n=1 Tax=Rhodohalobacter barkolensis TaxID=2053187 RepID=A0A2N0VKG3_9BACT|nr:O-antigen polymerase [Rhodohalobacter barkolensis]PKD44651.1 hypothetical protein CWD77_04090 [Rhodohalobacter barkolensis]
MVTSEIWYWYRLIPIIFFFFPFYKSIKSGNKIALVICGLYFFSSVGALFIMPEHLPWHNFETDSIFVFLFYSIVITPFLYFSLQIKPLKYATGIKLDKVLLFVVIVLCIGAIYSFFYQIPYAIRSLTFGAAATRHLLGLGNEILPESIFTTVAVGFPMFFYVYIILFYLSLTNKWNKIIQISLFLGIIAFIVNVLTVAGRDGIVLSFIGLVIGYFYFENVLTKKTKKRLRIVLFSLIVSGVSMLGYISFDRFGDRTENVFISTMQYGVLNYYSMQPFTLNSTVKIHNEFDLGRSNFPLVYSIKGESVNSSKRDLSHPYTWNFGSFVKSLYQSGGYFYTIIISAIFYFIFYQYKRTNDKNIIRTSFIISFYMMFMTSGLFYFRLGNNSGNMFMLLSFIAIILFKFKYKV